MNKVSKLIKQMIIFCSMLVVSNQLHAHALEQSYLFLTVNDKTLEMKFEMTITDMNLALGTTFPMDKIVTEAQVQPHLVSLRRYFNDKVSMNVDYEMQIDKLEIVSLPQAQYVVVPIIFPNMQELPEQLTLDYRILFDVVPQHRGFLIVYNDWRTGTFNQESNVALVFAPGDSSKSLDLQNASVFDGFVEMTKLGVHHIWLGIDHVLFLLALLLPSVMVRTKQGWQSAPSFYPAFIYVVKIVTVFTVAHSITLSAATFGWVSLSSRLVESIIAISIAIAAFDILRPIFSGRIWTIVFAFGLFHGLGFASVLSSLGIPQNYMTLSLLAFNLGVELGQVAIIAVVFPLIFVLRSTQFYRVYTLRYGAIGLIAISLYWFIERGFAIDLPAGQVAKWLLGNVGIAI